MNALWLNSEESNDLVALVADLLKTKPPPAQRVLNFTSVGMPFSRQSCPESLAGSTLIPS
jgi:hypothetical protein